MLDAMMKRRTRFHCSGMGFGLTMSYPTEMSAPSVRSVMSMSIKTGSWKKDGNGAQWVFPS
jgi:hypothetical protein